MNNKKRKNLKQSQVRCPYCGSIAILRSADGIYLENSKREMLYVCKNYPECDSYVCVHPNTETPVGSLANKELRTLRRTAHYYFDQIHQSGIMSKRDAYKWLADMLDAPLPEAHIGHLSEYYCQKVIEESQKFLKNHNQKKRNSRAKGDKNLKLIQGGISS